MPVNITPRKQTGNKQANTTNARKYKREQANWKIAWKKLFHNTTKQRTRGKNAREMHAGM